MDAPPLPTVAPSLQRPLWAPFGGAPEGVDEAGAGSPRQPPAAHTPASQAPALHPPTAHPPTSATVRPTLEPQALHPALWHAHQLGSRGEAGVPSGFPELDRQLPGGGWPCGALTELLLPCPGVGEIRLLSLCLAALQRAGRLVMLFDPPSGLSAAALTQLGLNLDELLIVHTRARVIPGTDSLWAMEQALKSGHVGALVGWLPPRLRAERLRRLQIAAHAHAGPAFVLREIAAAQRPSAAPLRLGLQVAGADLLAVRLLKRRGPPLEVPIRLALPAVLGLKAQGRAAVAAARVRGREQGRRQAETFEKSVA